MEVGAYLIRKSREQDRNWATGMTFAGVALGILVMYATAFLVQV